MERSLGTVESLHRDIEEQVEEILGYAVTVEDFGVEGSWRQLARDGQVGFCLVPEEASSRTHYRSRKDLWLPLLPLGVQRTQSYNEFQPYCSWAALWRAAGRDRYELVSGQWAFCLSRGSNNSRPIFRAEWNLLEPGKNDVQPHWHFDEQIARTWRKEVQQPHGTHLHELEELESSDESSVRSEHPPDEGLVGYDVKGVHLGMGGWENGDGCEWNCAIRDGPHFVDWSVEVLRLLVGEMSEVEVEVEA